MTEEERPLRIDLGCGAAKKEGHVGLDYVEGDGVDHVLDLTADPYPFDDATVDAVFSAHFLEHIDEPNHVFSEIGRVAKDGATIEFWTPYAFSAEAFLYGHLHQLTEEHWMQFCVYHRDAYADMLGGRWLLRKIKYNVPQPVVADLRARGVPVEFAVQYLKDVVYEFGVFIEFRRDRDVEVVMPAKVWGSDRYGEDIPLDPVPLISPPAPAQASAAAEVAAAPAPGPRSRVDALMAKVRNRVPRVTGRG